MTQAAEKLLQQVMELEPSDRIALAGRIFESSEGPCEISADPEYEKAWEEEIRLRSDELDRGEAVLIPWEQVHQKMIQMRDRQPECDGE